MKVHRFATTANALPALAYQSVFERRKIEVLLALVPGYEQHIANLHAQYWRTPFSPFVSLTEDVNALLQTTDRRIASVVTGYPDANMKAPYLFTYEIPQSRLVRPDYDMIEAARIEREVLFRGRNIGDFLVESETRLNPYQPGDAANFQPSKGVNGGMMG